MTSTQTAPDSQLAEAHLGNGSVDVPVRPMAFERYVADLPKYFATDGDIVSGEVLRH